MKDDQYNGLGWPAVLFFVVILLFGIALIGHAPKWPIYVSIMIWWAFVIYTTIHINHEKDPRPSEDKNSRSIS